MKNLLCTYTRDIWKGQHGVLEIRSSAIWYVDISSTNRAVWQLIRINHSTNRRSPIIQRQSQSMLIQNLFLTLSATELYGVFILAVLLVPPVLIEPLDMSVDPFSSMIAFSFTFGSGLAERQNSLHGAWPLAWGTLATVGTGVEWPDGLLCGRLDMRPRMSAMRSAFVSSLWVCCCIDLRRRSVCCRKRANNHGTYCPYPTQSCSERRRG